YNCHKKCTIYDLGKAERPVRCSYTKIGGLQQIHECRCRRNCLKTEVRCDENEGWVIDETLCQVLLVLVVVFLLTYIIYWRYREESKAWLMRKMRRRPLPRPPMQHPGTEDHYEYIDINAHTKSDRDAIPNRIEIEPRKNPSVPFVVPHELIKFSDEFVAPLNEELNSDESVEDNNAVMNEPRTSSNPAKKLNSDESTNESANQGTSLALSNPTKIFEEMDSSTIKEGDAKNSVASFESIDEETSPSTSGGNLNSTIDSNALSNTLSTDESSNEPNLLCTERIFNRHLSFSSEEHAIWMLKQLQSKL
ncbi:hypothetical protein B566_EDAN013156, partial [Ephemera danica]